MSSVMAEPAALLRYDSASLVFVKDTFITVVPAPHEANARTTRSVPPSLRLARGARAGAVSKLECDGLKPNVARVNSLGEVSTLAASSSACESDASSDAGMGSMFEDDAHSSSGATSVLEHVPLARGTPAPDHTPPPQSGTTDSVAITLCDLVGPPPIPAVARPRQCLNKRAKAFVSKSASNRCQLRSQVDNVLAAIHVALVSVGIVMEVSIVPGFQDWSIVASILPQNVHMKELVLSKAKAALLQATERVPSVCCLGYKAQPFTSTPDGFSTKLGAMADEGAACWDMYSKGTCRRGSFCKWEHPTSVATLNMSVVVV